MKSQQKVTKKKQDVSTEDIASLEQAFIEGKSKILLEFLKEHKVALQPVLEYTQYGVRPNVKLVKYEGQN